MYKRYNTVGYLIPYIPYPTPIDHQAISASPGYTNLGYRVYRGIPKSCIRSP